MVRLDGAASCSGHMSRARSYCSHLSELFAFCHSHLVNPTSSTGQSFCREVYKSMRMQAEDVGVVTSRRCKVTGGWAKFDSVFLSRSPSLPFCSAPLPRGIRFSHHHFKTPPSTGTSWPVMYLLASEARKMHAPRMSSGSATVPLMISSFQLSNR